MNPLLFPVLHRIALLAHCDIGVITPAHPLWLLLLIPLAIAVLGLMPRCARLLPRVAALGMVLHSCVATFVCLPILRHPSPVRADFGLDGLSAAFVLIVTLVSAAALIQAAFLLPAERGEDDGMTDRRFGGFYTLCGLFMLAMYAVLLAQHLGYVWIAMEATTLLSAPLVYFHRSRRSLEATWKYLLLCSVGIALALFGIMLITAALHTTSLTTLSLHVLQAHARELDPRLLRFGFIFCLLGFGTKAGLFPLHNWLPDAHSEAPAPASAILSGALLNCALVVIWRLAQLMQAAGQGALVRQLLVPAGAITVLAAGIMLIRQHDLKRMWAYSSVEHVGLLTLAIGIGSTPLFILHALNHSLVKVALFLLAGNIYHLYGSKSLSKLSGLLKAAPLWGIALLAGTVAIAGSPPFGTFISEWLLLRDIASAGEFVAAGVVLLGLTITCIALLSHVSRIVFGRAPVLTVSPARAWAIVPVVLLVASLATSLAILPPIMACLTHLTPAGGMLP